jgi:type III secretory pathway component EscT
MGDALHKLPTDSQTRNTNEELEVIETISVPSSNNPERVYEEGTNAADTTEQVTGSSSVISELLNLLIIGVLFAILASDFFGSLVTRFAPIAEKWYYNLAIRTVIFIALYFVITNFALARKCKP